MPKQLSTRFSIVKRSAGQSAVEKASYISREEIGSEYDGNIYRPKYKEDLVHSEIGLPENAPKEYADRARLWNAVELSEKGKNAQLARMLKASLPNEWSYETAEEIVRKYVQDNFVSKGMFDIERFYYDSFFTIISLFIRESQRAAIIKEFLFISCNTQNTIHWFKNRIFFNIFFIC